MKMVAFKILTLFAFTTTVFGTTPPTTEQSQRVHLDKDAINVTDFSQLYNYGSPVNFGIFGARQVVISYENLTAYHGEIILYLGNEQYSKTEEAKINVSSAIRVDETTYEVTEMVDIKPGSRKVFVSQSHKYQHERREIKSISFIPKKLNSENPYRIVSTSNKLGITIKSWDNPRLRDKTTPMLYDSICEDRQSFFFQQNEKGDYRIMKIYKGMTEHEVKYLEVRDSNRKIGDEVILVKYPGSEDNVWSLLPGRGDGEVKIQSKLTGTCISAIHGLGSDLVMVDCKNGKANDWSLKFCDG